MKKVWRASSKLAFLEAGEYFDDHLRDRRFTIAHARAAKYTPRKGELQPVGSKAWKATTAGQKWRKEGHDRPLEMSGETRDKLRTGGNKKATSNRVTIRYPQARVFNRRHSKSQINMSEEFTRLIPEEEIQLGQVYDRRLDRELADSNYTETTTVAAA